MSKKKDISIFKNKKFRVVLDIYTPRPHYILLHNEIDRDKKIKSIYDFSNSLYKLFIRTLQNSFKKLGPCIFSIHLGLYQSKDSPYFHAHYLVPFDKFVHMYIKRYQNEKYLHRLFTYEQRLKIEGSRYKSNDLSCIYENDPYIEFPKLNTNYSIKFHDHQPRVAFIHNKYGENRLADLMSAMLEFIRYYELNDRNKGGCHLCIQNKMSIDSEYNDIIGYIQIDIVNYYRICPNRENWVKNFEKNGYMVYT